VHTWILLAVQDRSLLSGHCPWSQPPYLSYGGQWVFVPDGPDAGGLWSDPPWMPYLIWCQCQSAE
jgi:hypothetical protein